MDLTDLQVELRAIEGQLASLQGAIEKMKPTPEKEQQRAFEEITMLAARQPLVRKSILQAPSPTKKLLLAGLAYLALLEEGGSLQRLLYLCRLAKGCGLDLTAEELYRLGRAFKKEELQALCRDVAPLKDTFLVEALVTAHLTGEAAADTLSAIADIAQLLAVEREELDVLARAAKGVLTNDMDCILSMPVPKGNSWSGRLGDYLSPAWLEGKRKHCGTISTTPNYSWDKPWLLFAKSVWIDEILKDGSIVRKGEVICSYKEKEGENSTRSFNIKAPCDGVVFSLKYTPKNDRIHEELAVCVVSYFDELPKVKSWAKQKFAS